MTPAPSAPCTRNSPGTASFSTSRGLNNNNNAAFTGLFEAILRTPAPSNAAMGPYSFSARAAAQHAKHHEEAAGSGVSCEPWRQHGDVP